ncbi:cyclodeaminase/cyclohydrolase family protein [Desulfitibacter alkalitolerans]|uniref:cyclodeaminase/cyclohydrolase family protein n=1 Tax=Desulfitibacter alkalitolerans TaxID=264641 RepID=UPI000481C9F9|nr:cyclodeaminase/cyclohydrolase family protein [Desulfitibacter alkalitolerans]
MLVELTGREFINAVSSESPAPGGGSVAAFAGALSAALVNMVINLTVGKEKFQEHEEELKEIRKKGYELQEQLTQYVDEDTRTFNLVMEAYKMPKDTEEAKAKRSEAIQGAMKKAAELPLEVAKCCLEIIIFSDVVITRGNPNCLSDGGVGCLMAHAGLKGAIFNVQINLGSIKDEQYKARLAEEIKNIEDEAENLTKQIIAKVKSRL